MADADSGNVRDEREGGEPERHDTTFAVSRTEPNEVALNVENKVDGDLTYYLDRESAIELATDLLAAVALR